MMEAEMAQVWDVVCGMTTELGNWESKSEYKGKTYYFCCDGCKGAFDKSPEYHIQNFAEEHPDVEPTPAQA
jgi:xanthine dehydrogenase accessory factor